MLVAGFAVHQPELIYIEMEHRCSNVRCSAVVATEGEVEVEDAEDGGGRLSSWP